MLTNGLYADKSFLSTSLKKNNRWTNVFTRSIVGNKIINKYGIDFDDSRPNSFCVFHSTCFSERKVSFNLRTRMDVKDLCDLIRQFRFGKNNKYTHFTSKYNTLQILLQRKYKCFNRWTCTLVQKIWWTLGVFGSKF